jgi:hypothetical protein
MIKGFMYGSIPPNDKLMRNLHFATRLAATAYACQANFTWLTSNDQYKHITLLDFDVIGGALPTLTLYKAAMEAQEQAHQKETRGIESSPAQPEISESQFEFNRLFGPHRVRFHLENMGEFTLPHGSAVELLEWKNKLSSWISDRSRSFIRRVREVSQINSPDPATAILNISKSTGRVSDILLEEINSLDHEASSLEGVVNDLELLEQLLDHATPIEELIGSSARERRSGEAFREIYSYLQAVRPQRKNNNLNDAINVTLLVRLFNAPAHERYRMPVLISQTRSLEKFSSQSGWFRLPRDQEPPVLIQDELYLMVTHSLLKWCENRYQGVIDEAEMLHFRAKELANLYRDLSRELTSDKDRGHSNYLWELIQHKLEVFQSEWLQPFKEAINSAKLDRAVFSNQVITSRMTRDLKVKHPDKLNQHIQHFLDALIPKLEAYQIPIFDSLDEGFTHTSKEDNQEQEMDKRFDLSVVENDGTLLQEVEVGELFDAQENIKANNDVRYVLHLKSIPVGALLAVDLWKDESKNHHYTAIVWPHNIGALKMWVKGVELLYTCLNTKLAKSANCSYTLFTRTKKLVGSDTLEHVPQALLQVLKPDKNRYWGDYLEIDVGQFTFFTDIEALEGKEMQAGLIMDSIRWDSHLQKAIATTMAETSSFPFPASQYRDILSFILRKIALVTTR